MLRQPIQQPTQRRILPSTQLISLGKKEIETIRSDLISRGFTSTYGGEGVTRARFVVTPYMRTLLPMDNSPNELAKPVREISAEVRVFSGYMGNSGYVGVGVLVFLGEETLAVLKQALPLIDHGLEHDIHTQHQRVFGGPIEPGAYAAVVGIDESVEQTLLRAEQLAHAVARNFENPFTPEEIEQVGLLRAALELEKGARENPLLNPESTSPAAIQVRNTLLGVQRTSIRQVSVRISIPEFELVAQKQR